MWPFSSNKRNSPVPSIRVGKISVHWDPQLEQWEFSDGEILYSLSDNAEFDVAVVDKIGLVKRWLADLDHEIDAEIKKHLEGWCEWKGEKHLVGIDVSNLIGKQEVDVSYDGGNEWGDLGVNIVITSGRIMRSYAGD